MTPALSIVMVSYAALVWTERALAAVAAHTEAAHEVIVVDNGSPDRTAARLSERLPDVRVIENPSNRGFGPASNQGAEAAAGPVVVFLNTEHSSSTAGTPGCCGHSRRRAPPPPCRASSSLTAVSSARVRCWAATAP